MIYSKWKKAGMYINVYNVAKDFFLHWSDLTMKLVLWPWSWDCWRGCPTIQWNPWRWPWCPSAHSDCSLSCLPSRSMEDESRSESAFGTLWRDNSVTETFLQQYFFKPQTWKIHVSITWENVKDFVIAFFLVLHVFLLYEKHNSHEKLYVNTVTNIILKTDYITIKINLHFISRVYKYIYISDCHFQFEHYFYQSQTELERTLLLLA